MANTIKFGLQWKVEDLVRVMDDFTVKGELDPEARQRIILSRDRIEKFNATGQVRYGINTGFGSLSKHIIEEKALLQKNLIESHAVGVGDPVNPRFVRGMLALRIQSICRGFSGVRLVTVDKLIAAFNANALSFVPERGTVGASGDLAPLSHMILGLMGKGLMWNPNTKKFEDAAAVLNELGLEPIELMEKEGLALNNGTQFITSHTAYYWYYAMRLWKQSAVIVAYSVEARRGQISAFDKRIHDAKPHAGQCEFAAIMRDMLCQGDDHPTDEHASERFRSHGRHQVQNGYSLRCAPQFTGPAGDILNWTQTTIETEMNSANDNPLIFALEGGSIDDGDVISGGNFHAQPIAMAADMIGMALTYICNGSERRMDSYTNAATNGFAPSCLVPNPGLNSGFMMPQYTTAAVTAQLRQMCNPASVHSLPTCENFEDVVSMGGWASRKLGIMLKCAYECLGIELLGATQLMDFTVYETDDGKPIWEKKRIPTTPPLEAVYSLVRNELGISFLEKDRYYNPDMKKCIEALYENRVWNVSHPNNA